MAASSSDSHPAKSARPVGRQFPCPHGSSKSPSLQASWLSSNCVPVLELITCGWSHPNSGSEVWGAPPLELHKLRVGEGWFPKGNSKCAIYYPKEVVGARQAKPTAIHSVHPFRTTNRIFQKADFDRMRDRLVWQPFFLHIFLPFEEKPLWTISSSSCKIATSAYTTWSL